MAKIRAKAWMNGLPTNFEKISEFSSIWKAMSRNRRESAPLTAAKRRGKNMDDRKTNLHLTRRFRLAQNWRINPLRRDFTRLRNRRMLWIKSEGRATVFLSIINVSCNICQLKRTLMLKRGPWFLIISRFLSLLADCARLSVHRIVEMTDVAALIHDRETTVWRFYTICKILWPLNLVLSALKVENRVIFQLQFMIKSWPFDPFHDILWSLRIAQSLLKGLNLAQREPRG